VGDQERAAARSGVAHLEAYAAGADQVGEPRKNPARFLAGAHAMPEQTGYYKMDKGMYAQHFRRFEYELKCAHPNAKEGNCIATVRSEGDLRALEELSDR